MVTAQKPEKKEKKKKKKGVLRIFINVKSLRKAICRVHYPLKTTEDVKQQFVL